MTHSNDTPRLAQAGGPPTLYAELMHESSGPLTFTARDEHGHPVEVTLREPTWEEAKERRHHTGGGMFSNRYELLAPTTLAQIATERRALYERSVANGQPIEAHRWAWRCAEVVLARMTAARPVSRVAHRVYRDHERPPADPALEDAASIPHTSMGKGVRSTFGELPNGTLNTIGRAARTMWRRRRWAQDWERYRAVVVVLRSRGFIGDLVRPDAEESAR